MDNADKKTVIRATFHFTFVSYSYDHKIKETGEVNIVDNNNFLTTAADLTKPPTAWSHNPIAAVGHIPGAVVRTVADRFGIGAQMGDFEEGSFLKNREEVYKMLYNGNFTHAFSGCGFRRSRSAVPIHAGTQSNACRGVRC